MEKGNKYAPSTIWAQIIITAPDVKLQSLNRRWEEKNDCPTTNNHRYFFLKGRISFFYTQYSEMRGEALGRKM